MLKIILEEQRKKISDLMKGHKTNGINSWKRKGEK